MKNVKTHTFASLDDFADFIAAGTRTKSLTASDYGSFYGCDYTEADRRARYGGNADMVARIEALVDEIECEMPALPVRGTMVPDLVGFVPHVPNYVAGLPDAMMTYSEAPSEAAPIRIYVDVCCSGGVGADQMAKRGAAIAAFAYLASMSRPVELFAVAGMNSGGKKGHAQVPVIRLGNSPLDVGAVAYALTDPSMLRRLCFAYAEQASQSSFIHWGWNSQPQSDKYQNNMRTACGMSDDDIFLHGGYLNDRVFDNPVAWVQDMLRKHCNAEQE